jgi:hypothetical protein
VFVASNAMTSEPYPFAAFECHDSRALPFHSTYLTSSVVCVCAVTIPFFFLTYVKLVLLSSFRNLVCFVLFLPLLYYYYTLRELIPRKNKTSIYYKSDSFYLRYLNWMITGVTSERIHLLHGLFKSTLNFSLFMNFVY